MINWRVRLKNRTFWMTFIPAVFLLLQGIAELIGINVNLTDYQDRMMDIINAVFVILATTGIVVDPTTEGIVDSRLAMTYTEPKEKGL